VTTAFVLFNIATQRPHAVLWRRDQLARWQTSNTRIISEIDVSHIDRIAAEKLSLAALPVSALFEGIGRYYGQAR
jgi:hypothetical protein